MEADTEGLARRMARWTLAGSAGALAGPLLVATVVAVGGSWRLAFACCAACSVVAWLAVAASGLSREAPDDDSPAGDEAGWPGWPLAVSIVRSSGALRWLFLLEVSDLLLDVFTAFLALYLVAVAHASPAVAALGVAVRLGAGLAGDVILIQLLDRLGSRRVLRVSVWLTLALLPAFLLVPGLGIKLLLLGALTVGLLAQHFGLSWAMVALCVAPLVMLVGAGRAWTRLGCRD